MASITTTIIMNSAGQSMMAAVRRVPPDLPGLILACTACLISRNAIAEFVPEVSLGEIYSDNITLSRSGNKEDDLVTQIAPAFHADYESRRLRLDADYRMQALFYLNNKDSNETFHQLDSSAETALPADFFFDASARVSQQIINPERGLVASNIPINRNFTDVVALKASPYWQYVDDSGWRTLFRYTRGDVDYALEDETGDDHIEDSQLRRSQFSTGTTESGQTLQWSLDYSKDDVRFESGAENIFEQASLQLGLLVGHKTVFFVTRGEEDNEFAINPAAEKPTGSFWNVGIRWNSPPKNAFKVFGGERYFGDYYGLSWDHKGHYINTSMEYSQELYTDAQAQLGAHAFINGQFIERELDRPATDVYLSDRLLMSVEVEHALTSIRLSVTGENREFQSTGEEGRIRFVELEWALQMSARQRVFASVDTRTDRLVGDAREDTLNRFRAGVTRDLGPRTSAGLTFLRAMFDSNFPGVDYVENSLSLSFTRSF